jgi:hypothetical protein
MNNVTTTLFANLGTEIAQGDPGFTVRERRNNQRFSKSAHELLLVVGVSVKLGPDRIMIRYSDVG